MVIRKRFVCLWYPTLNAGTNSGAAFAWPFTAICDRSVPDSAECIFKATAFNQYGCSKCNASLHGQGVFTGLRSIDV